MNVAILILAAGNSSRMGTPKQLLAVGDTTLLGVAIQNALKSNAQNMFCVLGANAKTIEPTISQYNIETIINPDYQKGLSSSIIRGVEELLNFDAILITLSDQPKVDSEYLNQMISEYKNNPHPIIASLYDGIMGVPALFPKHYYPELLKLEGDKGAKQLLNSRDILIKTMKSSVNLLDIDTPEDYQKFLKKQ
jgi:molybdenum cofactor cytidylyltransferase